MTSTPDRVLIIKLVAETVQAGARQRLACEVLNITERTLERWKSPDTPPDDQRPIVQRPAPPNKMTEHERSIVLETVNQKEFQSLPPSQIVPALADRGQYICSESSMYRILRLHNEQNHRGRAAEPVSKHKSTHCATGPLQVFTWDITYLAGPAKGMFYYLYLILDIYSRYIVGWEVWENESAENASLLIRKTVLKHGIQPHAHPLVLHSDNGSPMKGAIMLETMYKLGITPSRSRPRVSDDNPYSESMFRTLKYRPEFPSAGFANLEAARTWTHGFVHWYNHDHHHSAIAFVSPHQVHTGAAGDIVMRRKILYEMARAENPHRWIQNKTRNWKLPTKVWLNPDKDGCNIEDEASEPA